MNYQLAANLKKKLQQREFCLGSWITLGHPAIGEIMASKGFDFLVVDMEHTVIGLESAQHLFRSIESKGCVPIARLGESSENLIKRVLDAGAYGILVALVNDAEGVKKVVSAAKYPPRGIRGVGLARAQGYGYDFERYKKWAADGPIVMTLVEHIEAIRNIDSILSVEGLDGTLIGPYDLSGSLGCPGEFERREVKQAIAAYEAACKRHQKPMGFHVVHPDAKKIMEKKKKGYTFVGAGLDILHLGDSCQGIVDTCRRAS